MRATRAWTSAPTHIWHGSIVTYSVAPGEPVVPDAPGRVPEGHDLGVRGWIVRGDRLIEPFADDGVVQDDDGADGDLAAFLCPSRQVQRGPHEPLVFGPRRRSVTQHFTIAQSPISLRAQALTGGESVRERPARPEDGPRSTAATRTSAN